MGIYKDRNSLDGRVSVVTGGAGILGSETSSALADAGSKVAVVDLDESAAQAHAMVLSQKYGIQALGIRCDVTDEASIGDMINQVESELGPIDILHNNAATKGSDLTKVFAPLDEFSMETWAEIMHVNVDGLFAVARAVGVGMAARNRGSIVQTASIYGAFMGPDQRIYEGSNYLGGPINTPPVYSASKAAVHGLTLYLATYWADRGVRVNTISPGESVLVKMEYFTTDTVPEYPWGAWQTLMRSHQACFSSHPTPRVMSRGRISLSTADLAPGSDLD